MSPLLIVSAGYGIFLLAGAYFGAKAGSNVSLWAGLASGLVALVSAYLSTSNSVLAIKILFAVSGLLSVTFCMRFLSTHKFMPSGMLLTVSLLVFLFSLSNILKK